MTASSSSTASGLAPASWPPPGRAAAPAARGGEADHAHDDAALDEARAALRLAVSQIVEAREPRRRCSQGRTEAPWRGLVAARWTLVDRFEHGGQRYVVAQQSGHDVDAASELSPRERTVLAAAASGCHDKLIAYELGLADSTVRVLMFRAMRKLGAASRAEAIARFRPSPERR